jgi:hypothetical protein
MTHTSKVMIRFRNAFRSLLGKFWVEFLVLALYLILTLALLYPFSVLNMGRQLIGNTADTYQSLWDLWWVKHSLLSLSNPYVTNFIYYPYGADLYVHTLSPAAGLLTIPFQLTGGLIFSFNLIIIASFILGGYGAYQLAKYVTKDKKASFFAGLVFTFSTYHFAKALGDMNLASIEWIPFYILFLLKMRQEKSAKNIAGAVVFFVLTALMADLQYVLFLGLFTMLYVVYELALNRQQISSFLKRFVVMTAIFAALMLLIFEPLMSGWLSGQYSYAMSSLSYSSAVSGDLLGFFTPSQFNPLFGAASHGIVQTFTTTSLYSLEGNTYIGYTVLALTIYAAFKLRKEAKFWLLSAAVFLILTLGPVLHVMGNSSLNIPLPETLIAYAIPIFRVPARMVVMATLCLAVAAAIALKHTNAHISKLKNGKVLCILFIVLLSGTFLAECNFLPYRVAPSMQVPQFYYQLAQMNGTFGVLDLPQNYSANSLYMYYGTVSQKPLVSGSTSHTSPQEILLREAIPLVSQTGFACNGKNPMAETDIITQDFNETNVNALVYFNVKYVILHKDQMNSTAYEEMATYLSTFLGPPGYNDKTITAFEVKQTALKGIFAYVTNGWWDIEGQNGWPTRWMENNGKIEIISPADQFCNLTFTVGTQYTNKSLSVNLNGQLIGIFQVRFSEPRQITLSVLLKKGVNELSFTSNQTYIPSKLDSNTTDNRLLSVYIKNVQIS